MTVALRNVDVNFLEVLKSLVKIKQEVEIVQIDETVLENNLSKHELHVKQINEVYAEVPREEQVFTCNAAKSAIWEMIKDDSW